jgi:proline racemase
MKIERIITTIDSHTAGEPTRVVIGGIPHIPGKTIAEKKRYFEENLDHIRKSIMSEPRGHSDMFGSVLTAPCDPSADIGLIFMDTGGYLNMCGHGTIGAVTILVETGMIKAVAPVTEVTLDTPAGIIKARAIIRDEKVVEVSFENVPSFLYKKDVPINFEGKKIPVDIAFGGNFFALVRASDIGEQLSFNKLGKLTEKGMEILRTVRKEIPVKHPLQKHINSVDLVEIYESDKYDKFRAKNVVIFGDSQYDRSPCGTGTCAKMATLSAKGLIKPGEEYVHESILNTFFTGCIVKKTKVGKFDAVIPRLSGSAFITGFNNLLINRDDPFRHGIDRVAE